MKHDTPESGMWTTSDDPERWSGSVFYDSKEEAIENADPDDRYVGQVTKITDDAIARGFLRDPDEADENIRMQDEWSWRDDPIINPVSDAAYEELVEMVEGWVKKHELTPVTFYVLEVEQW